jgi:hypothetical protein
VQCTYGFVEQLCYRCSPPTPPQPFASVATTSCSVCKDAMQECDAGAEKTAYRCSLLRETGAVQLSNPSSPPTSSASASKRKVFVRSNIFAR